MKLHLKSLISAAVIASGLAVASIAVATPLTIGSSVQVSDQSGGVFGPSPSTTDSNGLYSSVAFSLNYGSNVYASAGLFVLNYSANSGASWNQFYSFCLEPDVYLTPFSNPYTVNAVGSAGSPAYPQALIGELWGRYRGSVNDDLSAAAFQVALWELSYGATDLNLGMGAFRLTSGGGIFSTAQSWLSSLNGSGPMAQGLVVLVNNQSMADRQDLITQVPEPATLGLFGLGLLGLGLARRRKLQG
jgi:hypothetical protein